jgi:FYVE, RhoGEF and PH domain containing 5/6
VNATTEGKPLLSPGQMASIFSNFLDMLGFHESFYSTLNDHLGPYVRSTPPPSAFPALVSPTRTTFSTSSESTQLVASLLAQHIPFLSMYTPFVTAYPTIMASLHNLTSPHSKSYSPLFAAWLREKEADPRCGKFGLRDWLLTLVQRCPRYLLLMREFVGYMEANEPEYKEQEEVIRMLERSEY